MAGDDSLKAQLHEKLNDFSTLTRKLLEVVHGEKPSFGITGATGGVGGATNESVIDVLDKLIDSDREIQRLVQTALEMRVCQREIEWLDSQLERRQLEMIDFQNRLHDSEKLLEVAVYHGKQKMESIQRAKEGAVKPEVLIRYAHRISQASTVVSPVGWQPSDPRRPYPQDIEMRAGLLGGLQTTAPNTSVGRRQSSTTSVEGPMKSQSLGIMGQEFS